MLDPTKRVGLLATIKQNRRDSGNFSESCHSDVSEQHKRTCSDREAAVERQEGKDETFERNQSNGDIIRTNTCICDDDFILTDKATRLKRQPNIKATSDEFKHLISISETEACLRESRLLRNLITNNDVKRDVSGYTPERPFKRSSPRTVDPLLHENQNHTDVDVINRCDTLINQLQDVTQKYFQLVGWYQKAKKICYLMIAVNAVLLVTIVPLLVFLSKISHGRSRHEDGGNGFALEGENQYQICYACSDLKPGTPFSLETLHDVTEKEETCCFRSITSVLKSLYRNFGNALSDNTEKVRLKLFGLNKRLLQLEVGLAPNTSNVIGNILQIMAPKEKTAVHLLSMKDVPVSQSYDTFNKFIKLRWTLSEGSTILRGNVQLSDDRLNVRVTSEAYYFFYSRIRFMHKENDTYRRKTPLRYLVYRKRGSISSYIHEAKLSCVFNDLFQEHSVTTELILHLNRDDEIFVSIDEASKQFLTTKTGAHSIGLFEI